MSNNTLLPSSLEPMSRNMDWCHLLLLAPEILIKALEAENHVVGKVKDPNKDNECVEFRHRLPLLFRILVVLGICQDGPFCDNPISNVAECKEGVDWIFGEVWVIVDEVFVGLRDGVDGVVDPSVGKDKGPV